MARSRKGARHITVNDVAYRWRATGNDGWISLVIWPADQDRHPAGALAGNFDYHQILVPRAFGDGWHAKHQVVITNRIVRRVILHAIEAHRYNPARKSPELRLRDLDSVIDLTDAMRSY